MSGPNDQVIADYRAHGGRLGDDWAGPVLLLHHTGARSGRERVNPMMYQAVGDAFAVFAAKAGADTDPDWLHNLRAHPEVSVEVGDGERVRTIEVTARVLDDAEREPIWRTQKERDPAFAGYEARTTRVIPVVLLERR